MTTLTTADSATPGLAVLARESATYTVSTSAGFDGVAWLQHRLNRDDWKSCYRVAPGDSGTVDGPGEYRVWIESIALADDLVVTFTENVDVLWRQSRANGVDMVLVTNRGLELPLTAEQISVGYMRRPVHDRLDDVVSVRDFGAAGDGSTNDVAAFEAAKDAGGLVLISKASAGYALSTPVVSNDGVAAWLPDPTLTWDQLTDGGKLSLWRGRATGSITNGSNIWRFSDRAFFGYAASAFAGDTHVGTDGGNGWLKTAADGPWYLLANAGVIYMSGLGDATPAKNQPYGIVAAVRNSDLGGGGVIAFGAAVIQDEAGQAAWGGIVEGQREAGSSSLYGWEFAMKNKGNNAIATPLSLNSGGPAGVYGLWLHAAAQEDFGGAPTAPCTAAIAVIGGNGPTGLGSWNSGIVFAADSITSGTNEAIAMASGHKINWYNGAGSIGATIESNITLPGDKLTLRFSPSGLFLLNYAGKGMLSVAVPDNGVNYIGLNCAPTGTSPQIVALGDDSDLDLHLVPKGTGKVRFGALTANADAPVTGYITIKDSSGVTRKLAVIA